MQTAKTYTAEIKSRGQLTIPKKIRESGILEEGQVVSLILMGDSVLISPKRLPLDEARREIKKIFKASGVSAEELLDGIQEERRELFEKTYRNREEFNQETARLPGEDRVGFGVNCRQ